MTIRALPPRSDGRRLVDEDSFMKEMDALARLHNRYILPLEGACAETDPITGHQQVLLLYPYSSADMTLRDRLSAYPSSLGYRKRLGLMVGVARGMATLHGMDPPFLHLNISTSNIILDRTGVPRIGDVGVTRALTMVHGEQMRRDRLDWPPSGYLDPDYAKAGLKSDVYGLGVVFLELLSGMPAYDDNLDPPELAVRFMATYDDDDDDDVTAWLDDKARWEESGVVERLVRLIASCLRCPSGDRLSTFDLLRALEELVAGG